MLKHVNRVHCEDEKEEGGEREGEGEGGKGGKEEEKKNEEEKKKKQRRKRRRAMIERKLRQGRCKDTVMSDHISYEMPSCKTPAVSTPGK